LIALAKDLMMESVNNLPNATDETSALLKYKFRKLSLSALWNGWQHSANRILRSAYSLPIGVYLQFWCLVRIL